MITASISGGKKWETILKRLAAERLGLRVGILEGATTPGGQPIAEYAAVQEYGGTMTIPARPATLKFRKSDKTGRDVFAKASRKRGITKVRNVVIPAHTVTVPPRPFLRTAVNQFSGRWASVMEHELAGRATSRGGVQDALDSLGEVMAKDVQELINTTSLPPPLAPSTVAAKKAGGSPHPEHALIDTGAMLRAIRYEVVPLDGGKK